MSDVSVSSDEAASVAGSEEEKAEEDLSVYIGESTSEERMWKELVQLHKEMFWARISG